MVNHPPQIFKIVPHLMWADAKQKGIFLGAPIDLQDGFIHFSTADQVRETAAKHFAGQRDLLLLTVEAKALGSDLVYEVSRGGALFPHLYAPLTINAVIAEEALPLDADGHHIFPETLK